MILARLGLLQPLFFKQFSKFLKHNNNRNTLKYIVFFRGTMDDIMNVLRNIIRKMGRYSMTGKMDIYKLEQNNF